MEATAPSGQGIGTGDFTLGRALLIHARALVAARGDNLTQEEAILAPYSVQLNALSAGAHAGVTTDSPAMVKETIVTAFMLGYSAGVAAAKGE